MKALCDFCFDTMLPLLSRSFTKDESLTIATKANFEEYFAQCRDKYRRDEKVASSYLFESQGIITLPEKISDCHCKKATLSCFHQMSYMVKHIRVSILHPSICKGIRSDCILSRCPEVN